MPNMINKQFGNFQPPDPNANYNINNSGQYGIKGFDPEETRRKQRQLYQQMIQQGMNSAREGSLASGSFNGEQSAYNATQSSRNAMLGADVELDKYAHEDQYKRLNSMLDVDKNKMGWAGLDFQKYQYEDSKPSWLTGVLDFGTGLAGAFLEDGGQVPDSNHFMNNYGGYIPQHEMNSPPTPNQPTNDNTLIKAKTGESIMNNQATSLLGADTVNSINNTAKMAGSFFNGGGQLPKPMGGAGQNSLASSAPVNTMGSSQGNMGWFNPNGSGANNAGGLLGYGLNKATQMFADGGTVGGNDDFYETYPEVQAVNRQLDELIKRYANLQAYGGDLNDIEQLSQQIDNFKMLKQGLKIQLQKSGMPQNRTNPQGQPAQNAPDANQNGIPDNMEKTITIKTRPIVQQQPQQEDPQPYSGAGMARPF